MILILLLLLSVLLLFCSNTEGFSMSKKPMDHEWSNNQNGPLDDLDYITPYFIKF